MKFSYKEFLNQTLRVQLRNNLAHAILSAIPGGAQTILDIGCGDGSLAFLMQQQRPELQFSGVDVLGRGTTEIPVTLYDGSSIPFDDKSVDGCVMINMLHHAEDPRRVVREAQRIARKWIVIKDHYAHTFLDRITLTSIELLNPNNHILLRQRLEFFSPKQWAQFFEDLGLRGGKTVSGFPCYNRPIDFVCAGKRDFVTFFALT